MPDSEQSEPANEASLADKAPPPLSFANRQRRRQSGLLTALLGIAVAACLNWASAVFMPIALAVLLAIVLSPVVRGLRRVGIAEPIAAALILLLLLGGTGYGIYRLGSPAAEWLRALPQHLGEAQHRLSGLITPLRAVQQAGQTVANIAEGSQAQAPNEPTAVNGQQGGNARTGQAPQSGQAQNRPPTVVQQAGGSGGTGFALSRTAEALISIGATIVLTFFLLTSGDLFLRKLVTALPRFQDKKLAVEITQQVQRDMSTYLLTISLINIGLGAIIGGILWAFGLPTPALWAVMVALFNYVPYLGPITSFSVISLVSLLTFDTGWQIALPPLCFLCITLFEGNIFTPWVLARRLTLNTVAVFVSILFWGWMWGVPGTFMAVPLLAIFKILCDHIAPLKPAGEFLDR
jgi:predicted PurR-regulated permease PerM